AFIPAIQGFASDRLGSMQLAFGVSLLCFAWVGFYFWGELRHKKQALQTGRLVEEMP
ncbi:MAG: L-fucose:H+ symporter permease, partial [Pantoea sp.]|nr:L-fucose:H+ symporter permease [Pantoea sp.]